MATAQMTRVDSKTGKEAKTEKETKRSSRRVEKRGPAVTESGQECAQGFEQEEEVAEVMETTAVPFIKIENLEVHFFL